MNNFIKRKGKINAGKRTVPLGNVKLDVPAPVPVPNPEVVGLVLKMDPLVDGANA
jgi:hypothetical protein